MQEELNKKLVQIKDKLQPVFYESIEKIKDYTFISETDFKKYCENFEKTITEHNDEYISDVKFTMQSLLLEPIQKIISEYKQYVENIVATVGDFKMDELNIASYSIVHSLDVVTMTQQFEEKPFADVYPHDYINAFIASGMTEAKTTLGNTVLSAASLLVAGPVVGSAIAMGLNAIKNHKSKNSPSTAAHQKTVKAIAGEKALGLMLNSTQHKFDDNAKNIMNKAEQFIQRFK